MLVEPCNAGPVNIEWPSVTDAELALTSPLTDKDAGAEVIFWRVHVMDEVMGSSDIRSVLYHYVRIKIFNDRGREQQSTIDIPYAGKTGIQGVAGRTIKPDGSIIDLKKCQIVCDAFCRAGLHH